MVSSMAVTHLLGLGLGLGIRGRGRGRGRGRVRVGLLHGGDAPVRVGVRGRD